jgi:hypothetical protein
VTYSRGKLGEHYPYYLCIGRQQKRTTCRLRARPIELVEEQLIEHYRNVQVSAEGVEVTARAVLAELAEQRADTVRLRDWQQQRLKALDAERLKLLQAHYAGAIALDLLKTEQARLSGEIDQLQAALKVSIASGLRLQANADAAVALLDNCHRAYEQMSDRERRLMNQAFFKKVWVTEEGVAGWEYNEPFATLMRKHQAPEPHLIVEYEPTPQTEADDDFETMVDQVLYRRSPGRWARAYFDRGLKQNTLAGTSQRPPTTRGGDRRRTVRPVARRLPVTCPPRPAPAPVGGRRAASKARLRPSPGGVTRSPGQRSLSAGQDTDHDGSVGACPQSVDGAAGDNQHVTWVGRIGSVGDGDRRLPLDDQQGQLARRWMSGQLLGRLKAHHEHRGLPIRRDRGNDRLVRVESDSRPE